MATDGVATDGGTKRHPVHVASDGEATDGGTKRRPVNVASDGVATDGGTKRRHVNGATDGVATDGGTKRRHVNGATDEMGLSGYFTVTEPKRKLIFNTYFFDLHIFLKYDMTISQRNPINKIIILCIK